jgi:23S rRNA pseudouridine1911/1915/1917 synthase
MERRFHLVCDKENIRLDSYIAEALSLTRSKVQGLIAAGHVRVLNKPPKPSLKTKQGIVIEGELVIEEPAGLCPEEIPLSILYEDDYLLAVNKPINMVVHPSCGHRSGTLVNAILAHLGIDFRKHLRENLSSEHGEREGEAPMALPAEGATRAPFTDFRKHLRENLSSEHGEPGTRGHETSLFGQRPGIVHRLDKDTTGVILVAKDLQTQEALSSQFHDRKVEKTYRAVVQGKVKKEEGIVEGQMARHPTQRKKMALTGKGGRYSMTRFKVIGRLQGFTYLELYPKTGRTHQIRVHMASIGHPIVGDELYGGKAKTFASRPLLHAYRISIEHPITNAPLEIGAPVPEDLEEFINAHAVRA